MSLCDNKVTGIPVTGMSNGAGHKNVTLTHTCGNHMGYPYPCYALSVGTIFHPSWHLQEEKSFHRPLPFFSGIFTILFYFI